MWLSRIAHFRRARKAAEGAVVLDLLDLDSLEHECFPLHVNTQELISHSLGSLVTGAPEVFRLSEAELKRQFWNENLPAMVVSLLRNQHSREERQVVTSRPVRNGCRLSP